MSESVALLLLLVSLVLVTGRESAVAPPWLIRCSEWLLPPLLGLSAILVIWNIWGSLRPVTVFHDEAAYLLQARLFASGHAVGAAPPLPEFFEQAHVLVTPVLAPKYPPGFALAMIPGIWLGWPALVPLLLSGLTAALLFVLARRTSGGPVALLATVLWIVAPDNLRYRAAYFSELLSGALWLAGWWALLHWRDTGQRRFLLGLALCVGACAITRPLTALIYAIPVGVVVLRQVASQSRWRDLVLAIAGGVALLTLLPLHNRLVTGSWRMSPYSLYTRTYLPFDVIGFGLHPGQPERTLPPDLTRISDLFRGVHAEHTIDRVPQTLVLRAAAIVRGLSPVLPGLVGALIVLGLVVAQGPLRVAAATAALLVLVHLVYAHTVDWTLYYLEALPVLALLAALGWGHGLSWLVTRAGPAADRPRQASALVSGLAVLLLLLAVFPAALDRARTVRRENTFVASTFHRALARVPGHAIVFVHYMEGHHAEFSLVTNVPDLNTAPVWIAYDRDDNARLIRLAPERTSFRYLEAEGRMVPLAGAGSSSPAALH